MADLSNWSYADDFSVHEAACLIVGLEPAGVTEDPRVNHVMRRMEKVYSVTLNLTGWDVWGPPEDEDLEVYCPPYAPNPHEARLPSLKLEALWYAWKKKGSEEIKRWLNDEEDHEFLEQRFSSRTLAAWIASVGLKSAFAFGHTPVDPGPKGAKRRFTDQVQDMPGGEHSLPISFGGHRTVLLEKLEQAYIRFWSRYDPADPTTAPTNEQIADWLRSQNVSVRNAEVMATILRLDGLSTARR